MTTPGFCRLESRSFGLERCLNDVLKKIDKEGIKTSHGNTYVADIERESIKNGLSIDERVEKIDDAIMSTATDILSSFFNKRYGRA